MDDRHAHQPGKHIVGLGGIGGQHCVFQAAPSLANADGPTQVIADFQGKGPVAAVDGVLNIAQHVGEAHRVRFAQFLLTGIAIRDLHIGLIAAEHLLSDAACRRGATCAGRLCRRGTPAANG